MQRSWKGLLIFVVFFSDPLTAQPHDPDVKALMRIAQVYDIPMAVNRATADFMITSLYMDTEYDHEVINFRKYKGREQTLCNRRLVRLWIFCPWGQQDGRICQYVYLAAVPVAFAFWELSH